MNSFAVTPLPPEWRLFAGIWVVVDALLTEAQGPIGLWLRSPS
jgi:hypothetical protein